MRSRLGAGRTVIISTPNKDIYTYGVGVQNQYHCSEMTQTEFVDALQARFRNVCLSPQRPSCICGWSLRALAADVSIWNRIRGLRRLHHSVRLRFAPRVVCEPTDEQRSGVVEQILATGQSRYEFLSPHVLRPHRKWTRGTAHLSNSNCDSLEGAVLLDEPMPKEASSSPTSITRVFCRDASKAFCSKPIRISN